MESDNRDMRLSPYFISFIKNDFYNLMYQFLAIALPIITVPYVSRTLGASALGEYYYIAAMLSPSYESEALEYLIKKAEEGNTYAEYALAMFYDNNSKVSFDYKIIFNLYMKAAKKNYPPALFKAGYMYIYGRGVKEDVSKGGKLIKEAAKLGFIDAQIFTAQ